MKKKLIGYYDYTVILTYCGMLFSFIGIILAMDTRYWDAVVCLIVAGVCDMFDGAVASTKDRNRMEKTFGIQIDSLSDLISFGLAPAIFSYMISGKQLIVALFAGLYSLCALIRLAYFNVLEQDRQAQAVEGKKKFLGMPVTTIALLLPLLFVIDCFVNWNREIVFSIMLIAVSIGFVLPIEIEKPRAAGKILLMAIGLAEVISLVVVFRMGLI